MPRLGPTLSFRSLDAKRACLFSVIVVIAWPSLSSAKRPVSHVAPQDLVAPSGSSNNSGFVLPNTRLSSGSVVGSEHDLLARIRKVCDREQSLAAKEADFERRKQAVFVDEQTAASHERAEPNLIAAARTTHQLRQWLHARSPRWLVAAKRKVFGIAGSRPNTTPPTGT